MLASLAPVSHAKACRLLDHGPTVLERRRGDRRNVMAAAWAMAVDVEPGKVAVVLDRQTWTRALLEAEGSFVLTVPCADQPVSWLASGTGSSSSSTEISALC